MKEKSNWSTESPTPDQLKEFFVQIEAGDITKKKLESFLGNGNNKEGSKPTLSQIQAQKIMGQNFFGVKDATEHFGVKPTEEQLKALSEIPYSEKVLKECKDTHILVAILPISILTIREMIREKVDSKLFYNQTWYNDEDFAKEKGKVCWKLIRKNPVPSSISKDWKEQLELIDENEEVPTARAMIYTIAGYYLKMGEKLFEHTYVRTSSTDSDGGYVIVGYFESSGIHAYSYWDDLCSFVVGIASSWKS
ncbi:MAG: hypothetical protein R6T92_10910 [Desulfosalsimonadaceae bacterium]